MKKLKYLFLLIVMLLPMVVFADVATPDVVTFKVKVTSKTAYLYQADYLDSISDASSVDMMIPTKTDIKVKKGTTFSVSNEMYEEIGEEKKLFLEISYKDDIYYILNDDVKVLSYNENDDNVYLDKNTYYIFTGSAYLFEKPSLTSDKLDDSTINEKETVKSTAMIGDTWAKVKLSNDVVGWLYVSSTYMNPYDDTLIVRKNTDHNLNIIYNDTTCTTTKEIMKWSKQVTATEDICNFEVPKNTVLEPLYYYRDYAYVEYQDDYIWMYAEYNTATINPYGIYCYSLNNDMDLFSYVGDDTPVNNIAKGSLFSVLTEIYDSYYERNYAYIYSEDLNDYFWVESDQADENWDYTDTCKDVPLVADIVTEDPDDDPTYDEPTSVDKKDLIHKVVMGVCIVVIIVLVILIFINRKNSYIDKKESLKQVNEEIEKTQSIPIVKKEEIEKDKKKKDK